ncbi:TIGR02206 family membrane protein [Parasphingorhabdus pacifica]
MLGAQRTFEAYGPSHWALIALLVGGVLFIVVAGRHAGIRSEARVARGFAVAITGFLVPMLLYRFLPGQWDVHDSLPLHLCDLAWMVAAYALWTRSRWAYALTYYWGLTLTPQAMITPALDAPDFPHIDFIEFWGQHCLVVWAAVYLTWVSGLRPDWRSYRISVVVTVVWGAAMLGFNEIFGTNYGFLNSKPNNPSILDLMGGWPWYLLVELVVGMLAWALVTAPWTRARSGEGVGGS